jgi:hypothetical protein
MKRRGMAVSQPTDERPSRGDGILGSPRRGAKGLVLDDFCLRQCIAGCAWAMAFRLYANNCIFRHMRGP